MKKTKQPLAEIILLPEYEFTGKKGTRGKYHQAYSKGHTVKIHEADGAVSVHSFPLRKRRNYVRCRCPRIFPNI